MQNAGLDEAQTEIKLDGRNINNLRYTDDTSLMAESEKELKSLLIKVKKENEKVCLKLNIPVFQGISTVFSIAAVLVCIPTNSVGGFPFLHTLSSIYCL